MIKIDLITGFLGAGKTTFIRKYAKYLMDSGKNIGILENDFGAVNVDMMMLQDLMGDQCELEMISGGCDPETHRRRFKTKLISMGMCGYDRILVEPSGIFDVDEFFDILHEEPLDRWYEPGSVITIVDANLEEEMSEEENYILKSPMKRIHKIKTDKVVKETLSDETLERLRDNCDNIRDLAIINLLASTGMRVGELVKININDIDFENRECIVFGKGNKERPVYFDARTKIHLKNYINSRSDDNPALFVSLDKPYNRLQISGVEIRLRNLGKRLGINKVHPHKFRRTVATKAIDKGMPIEQVQNLLGHSQIDTTMHYAMVNQNNVKESHRKYVA